MASGTLSKEDIYGVGSLDTLSAANAANAETQQKANPNNPAVTGQIPADKKSIFHLKGNLLGQPLIIWFGLVILLIVAKYFVEK